MAANDFDFQVSSYILKIRLVGLHKTPSSVDQLELQRQKICHRYINQARSDILDIFTELLTDSSCCINENGTADCDLYSENELKYLQECYNAKKLIIDERCTTCLLKHGVAQSLGLKDAEFAIVVRITDWDLQQGKSFFREIGDTPGKDNNADIRDTGIDMQHRQTPTDDAANETEGTSDDSKDSFDTDQSTSSNAVDSKKPSKRKKKKKNKPNKKERKRRREESEHGSSTTDTGGRIATKERRKQQPDSRIAPRADDELQPLKVNEAKNHDSDSAIAPASHVDPPVELGFSTTMAHTKYSGITKESKHPEKSTASTSSQTGNRNSQVKGRDSKQIELKDQKKQTEPRFIKPAQSSAPKNQSNDSTQGQQRDMEDTDKSAKCAQGERVDKGNKSHSNLEHSQTVRHKNSEQQKQEGVCKSGMEKSDADRNLPVDDPLENEEQDQSSLSTEHMKHTQTHESDRNTEKLLASHVETPNLSEEGNQARKNTTQTDKGKIDMNVSSKRDSSQKRRSRDQNQDHHYQESQSTGNNAGSESYSGNVREKIEHTEANTNRADDTRMGMPKAGVGHQDILGPPNFIPDHLKDRVVLFRVYIGSTFKKVQSVTLHLLYNGSETYGYPMTQCENYQHIWYAMGNVEMHNKEIFCTYCYSIQHKIGFFDSVKSIFKEVKSITSEQNSRSLTTPITTDIFSISDYGQHDNLAIGLIAFVTMTADSVTDQTLTQLTLNFSRCYANLSRIVSEENRLFVVNELIENMKDRPDVCKLFLLSTVLLMCQTFGYRELIRSEIFRTDSAQCLLETLRLRYTYDRGIQQAMPELFKCCFIKVHSKLRQDLKPTLMDFVLTCYPNVCEEVVVEAAKVFTAFDKDTKRIIRAIMHIVNNSQANNDYQKELFEAVTYYVASFEVLFEAAKTVETMKCDDQIKQMFVAVANHIGEEKAKESVRTIRTPGKHGLECIEKLLQRIAQHCPHLCSVLQREIENVVFLVFHKTIHWGGEEVSLLYDIVLKQQIFCDMDSIRKLFDEVIKGFHKTEVLANVYCAILEKPISSDLNMTKMGTEVLKKAWEFNISKLDGQRLSDEYQILYRISYTKHGRENKKLLDHLGKYVVKNYLEKYSHKRLLDIISKITKEEPFIQRLREDALGLIEEKLHTPGKGDLQKWMQDSFGTQSTINIDDYVTKGTVVMALGVFTEKLKISDQSSSPNDSAAFSIILDHYEFIMRVISCTGYYASEIKNHISVKCVRDILLGFCKTLFEKRVAVAVLNRLWKQVPDWNAQVEKLLNNFQEKTTASKIAKFLEKLKRTFQTYAKELRVTEEVLENLLKLVHADTYSLFEWGVKEGILYVRELHQHLRSPENKVDITSFEAMFSDHTLQVVITACMRIEKHQNVPIFWAFVRDRMGSFDTEDTSNNEEQPTVSNKNDTKEHFEQKAVRSKLLHFLEFVAVTCSGDFEKEIQRIFISLDDVSVEDAQQYLSKDNFIRDLEILETVSKSTVPDFKRWGIGYFFLADKLHELAKALNAFWEAFQADIEAEPCELSPSMLGIRKVRDGHITSLLEITSLIEPLHGVFDQFKNNEAALGVLYELTVSRQMIQFLQIIEGDDLRNLIDAVEEYTEEYVQESTVSDFIQIHGFLRPLLKNQEMKSVSQLLGIFWDCVRIVDTDLASKINNCSTNFHNLKSLYMNVSNRGEVTKETINNILQHSEITMSVSLEKCEVQIDYQRHNNTKTLPLSELNDLTSRAHLIENTEQETGTTKIRQFVELAVLVNEAVEIADELCTRGHFDYQNFEKTIRHSTPENKIGVVRGLARKLESDLSEWEDSLEECRKEYFGLNFIFSEQIPILFDYFESGERERRAHAILRYISPTVHISCAQKTDVRDMVKQAKSPAEKLHKLGQVINVVCAKKHQLFSFPSSDLFKQMTQNVHACVRAGRLLVAPIAKTSDQTIPVMLSLYFNTTMTLPLANQVLFCLRDTTWEQVQMLIQRCLLCEEKKLFCLAWVEKLEYNVQNQLVKYLTSLTTDTSKTEYLLAVICRETSNHPLVQKFSSFVSHLTGMNSTSIRECFEKFAPNASSITSEVPGLGKTEYIYKTACELDLAVHSVPISGYINKEGLVKGVPDWIEKHMIHFDIGHLQNPEVIDTFLFELMVLKCATAGTHIVHFDQQLTFIEIANTLEHSLRNELCLVSHFGGSHLEWDDYKSMIISSELCSPAQVVCHYLDALQSSSLGNRDLIFCGKANIKPLQAQQCIDLLKRFFVIDVDMSYTIINVFLEVLAHQLKKLSTSQYFRIENLKATIGEKAVGNVRNKLVKILIDMSREFACRSIHTCRSTQANAILKTDEAFTESISARMTGMIQWEDSNHFLVLFNSLSSHTITPLYRNRSDVEKQEKHILDLIESQLKIKLPDFSEYGHNELQSMLEKLVCRRHDPKAQNRLKQMLPNYALTPDNLIKMVLIALRVTSRLPVILMGETGCGKTSLVRYLAITCGVSFFIINFHAGVQKEFIIEEVLRYNRMAVKEKKEIWVFLDEINTCDHLGVISDITCHHSCNGQRLSSNVVFIAACNPYRLRSLGQVLTAGLVEKAKTDEFSRLVYRVFPLPESMLDYIWDYGVLSQKDEKVYIKEMVKDVFKESRTCTIKSKLVEVLSLSQSFVREVEDNESCVSLRDVNRCRLLFPWFTRMLSERGRKGFKGKLSPEENKRRAVLLSLAHCYAVRLQTTEQRKKYWERVASVVYGRAGQGKEIMDLIREEQMEILNRMSIPEGIAKNTALRENVFVLFVSIMNKMPIFLVGKPGCSKSLSMQLLKNNLRGLDSTDKYFRTLPQLYVVSYQGSEASTSEGILKVFDKAERYMKHNSTENVLPVVLLDEVGLAEVSTHNPLKVLHSLLEPTGKEFPDIAVVGISNWALDAAKMNRAIHLSRPDLTVHELIDTAKSISTVGASPNESAKTSINPRILEALAEAYYKYQQNQKQKHFHGLRDFYSLIKCVSREVLTQGYAPDDERIHDVIYDGLLRNFGGGSELDFIISTFFSALGHTPPPGDVRIEKLIEDSLSDQRSRHLLLITRGDSLLDPLGQILRENGKSYEVIFGSNFEDDKCEGYQYRILSKIIHCMEMGKVLILKDLEDIYGSLYDMLNQNYTIVGKRKNCRIALGAHSNPMCHVHDNFKCVVLIEEHKLDFSDPPFLNRFEKQHLLFNDLISAEEQEIVDDLAKWVRDFADIADSSFRVADAFMGFNKDTLSSLVKLVTLEQKQDPAPERSLMERCQELLLMTTPPDAILRHTKSKLAQDNEIDCAKLRHEYFELPVHSGLVSTLKSPHELKTLVTSHNLSKYVIYTHSNVHTDVGMIIQDVFDTCVIQLSSLRTEKQLSSEIEQFYATSDAYALVIQCQPKNDAENMLLLKILIEQKERELRGETSIDKIVCLIVHIERIEEDQSFGSWQFAYSKEWTLCTVERLEECEESIRDMIGSSVIEMIQSPFCSLEQVVIDNLLWVFTCFKYARPEAQHDLLSLITSVSSCEPLLHCIQERILTRIEGEIDAHQANPFDPEHWQVAVACDRQSLLEEKSLTGAWKSYLTELIKTHLIKIVWFVEKYSAWNSILTSADDTLNIKLWQQLFFSFSDDTALDKCVAMGAESIPVTSERLPLRFPFIKLLFNDIHAAFILFDKEIRMGTAYKGIESIDSMDEVDVNCLLNQYVPVIEHNCERFCNDLSVFETNWSLLYRDILLLLSESLGYRAVQENWLKVLQCFLGHRSERELTNPWDESLASMFLSFFLVAPQFETFMSFVRHCSKEIPLLIERSLDEYSERKEDIDPLTDIIVKNICEKHLPYEENIKQNGSVEKLVSDIPTVLAFCSRLSCFPPQIHALRLFDDFFRVCPEFVCDFIEAFQATAHSDMKLTNLKINSAHSVQNSTVVIKNKADQLNDDDTCKRITKKSREDETEFRSDTPEMDTTQDIKGKMVAANTLKDNEETSDEERERFSLSQAKASSQLLNDQGVDDDLQDIRIDIHKNIDNEKNTSVDNEHLGSNGSHKSSDCSELLDSATLLQFFKALKNKVEDSGEKQKNYQRMFCLYVRRCIDANLDTPLFMSLLEELQNLPDESMMFAGAILKRVFQVDTYEILESCVEVKPAEWEGVNNILDEFCKSSPPAHVQTLMCDILQEEFQKKDIDVWEKSRLFQIASKTVHEGNISKDGLIYIVRLSFSKAYTHCLVNVLQDPQTRNDKSKIFHMGKIEECFVARNLDIGFGFLSAMHLYLVKHLNHGSLRSLQSVFKELEGVFRRLSAVEMPPPDVLEYSSGYRLVAKPEHHENVRKAIKSTEDLDKNFLPLLQNSQKDAIDVQNVLVAVAERFFWVRLLETARDSDKKWALDLEQKLKKVSLSGFEKSLLLHLCGRRDFQHKALQISTQTRDTEFYQAVTLFDMLLRVVPLQKNKEDCVLVKALLEPEKALKMETSTWQLSRNDLSATMMRCKCNHVIYSRQEMSRCPLCDDEFTGSSTVKSETKEAKVTQSVLEMLVNNQGVENLIDSVIQLLLQSAILSSLSMGISRRKKSEEIYQEFQAKWSSIAHMFALGDRDMCLMIEMILSKLLSKDVKTTSVDDLQTQVQAVLQNLPKHLEQYKSQVYSQLELSSGSLCRFLLELGYTEFVPESRFSRTPDLLDLTRHIRVQTLLMPSTYQFLEIVRDWQDKLKLVKLLHPIAKFVVLLNAAVNHRLTREQSQQSETHQFVSKHEKDLLEPLTDFIAAWDTVYESGGLFIEYLTNVSKIPYFFLNSNIDTFICKDQSHIILRIIETLVTWQNSFLERASMVALEGLNTCKFLMKEEHVVISVNKLYSVRPKQLIQFEWDEELLLYAQADARSGCGARVMYDLDAIELELANQLLLGKCYIETEEFDTVTYKNEMFHSSSNILMELREKLEQMELQKEVTTQLDSVHSEDQGLMNMLNGLLEVILPLILRTGGNPDESIAVFAARWKINFQATNNPKLCSLLENSVRLRHVVSLYEYSEDRAGEIAIRSLPEQFREKLPEEGKLAMNEIDKKICSAKIFMAVLRRLAMRCLRNRIALHVNFEPETPLNDVINSYNLWPLGMVKDDCLIGKQDQRLSFRELLPQSLRVKHFKEIYHYVDVNIIGMETKPTPGGQMSKPTWQTKRMRQMKGQRRV